MLVISSQLVNSLDLVCTLQACALAHHAYLGRLFVRVLMECRQHHPWSSSAVIGKPPVHTLVPASASASRPFAQRPVLSLGWYGAAQTLAKVAKLNAVKQQLWGLELAAPAAVGAGITGKSPILSVCCTEARAHGLDCCNGRLVQRAKAVAKSRLHGAKPSRSTSCHC